MVIGLCAAWCDVCREFQPLFERLAQARRDAVFVWLDIEDDNAVVGDIEVENFPALAVFRNGVPVFFGPTLPQESAVGRLLAALTQREPLAVPVPDEVAALPRRLARLAGQPGTERGP
jgi:thioredoxin reductase (NADPH)